MSNQESLSLKLDASFTSQVSPWLTSLTYFLMGRVVMPLYFQQIEVEGQEHLPREGAVILAPTHRSRWDPMVLGYVTGRWVTGRDLRHMVMLEQTQGLQGWFVKRLGGFPVNRENPGAASIRYSVQLLKNQEMLVLFPEGRISQDQHIKPIQPGVARIALQAMGDQPQSKLPIIPIAICYDRKPPISKGSRVKVKIGAPIEVYTEDGESKKQATTRITNNLETALKTLLSGNLPINPITSVPQSLS